MGEDYVRYYYNKDWQVLMETDEYDSALRTFIYGRGLDEVLVMNDADSGDDYFYINDHLKSPVVILEEDADIVERYEYDAYGKPTYWDGDFDYELEATLRGNPYYFTGRRIDFVGHSAWMIQYNRNRFYDYYTGCWLNQDPIGYQDGVNLYEYVGSSPMNRVDPMGNAWYEYIPGVGTIDTCWQAVFGDPPGTKVTDYASAWESGDLDPKITEGVDPFGNRTFNYDLRNTDPAEGEMEETCEYRVRRLYIGYVLNLSPHAIRWGIEIVVTGSCAILSFNPITAPVAVPCFIISGIVSGIDVSCTISLVLAMHEAAERAKNNCRPEGYWT